MSRWSPTPLWAPTSPWNPPPVWSTRLLDLRERHPSFFQQQQQYILLDTLHSEALQEYASNRAARAADIVRLTNFACRAQLKAGPAEEAYVCNVLPTMTNEEWLARALGSLCRAERLEKWHRESDRVALYTRQAERIRRGMDGGSGSSSSSSLKIGEAQHSRKESGHAQAVL